MNTTYAIIAIMQMNVWILLMLLLLLCKWMYECYYSYSTNLPVFLSTFFSHICIFYLIDNFILCRSVIFHCTLFYFLQTFFRHCEQTNIQNRKRLMPWASALLECLPEIVGFQPINRAPKLVRYWVTIYL